MISFRERVAMRWWALLARFLRYRPCRWDSGLYVYSWRFFWPVLVFSEFTDTSAPKPDGGLYWTLIFNQADEDAFFDSVGK